MSYGCHGITNESLKSLLLFAHRPPLPKNVIPAPFLPFHYLFSTSARLPPRPRTFPISEIPSPTVFQPTEQAAEGTCKKSLTLLGQQYLYCCFLPKIYHCPTVHPQSSHSWCFSYALTASVEVAHNSIESPSKPEYLSGTAGSIWDTSMGEGRRLQEDSVHDTNRYKRVLAVLL